MIDGRDQAGDELADQEDVAAQRRHQIEVQAALGDLAAHQVGEDGEADEEDDEAQEEELKERAELGGHLGRRDGVRRADPDRGRAHEEQERRQEGDRHHRQRAPAQERLAQLEREHGADLPPPHQHSGRGVAARRGGVRRVSRQLLPGATAPIRYW